MTTDLPAGMTMDAWRAAVDRLPAQWASVRHPGLAVWQGIDEAAQTVVWQMSVAGLKSLSQLGAPRSSVEVRSVIAQLAAPLEALHAAGVGAFDLSPQRVYATSSLSPCVIAPSPWLAEADASVAPGPFVAPEVGDASADIDPVRADVYALGALAWYLLTGETRPEGVTLLSEERPALAAWDELIDGCCRSRPERRFAAISSVISALPPAPGTPAHPSAAQPGAMTPASADRAGAGNSDDGAAPPDTTDPARKRRSRIWPALFGTAVLALLLVAGYLVLPMGGEGDLVNLGTDHERGFADTVVRYADRSYESASWQKWHAAANLGRLPVLGTYTADLQHITGIDEENLWVADSKGIVFRLMNGHWQVAANRPDAANPQVRLVDDQTLLMGGGYYGSEHVYLVQPGGVRIAPYDKKRTTRLDPNAAVTPIAPDLSYIHTYSQSYKLLEGRLTLSTPGTRKDAIVVDPDGAPVKMGNSPMTPNQFTHSATFAPGEVYAVWMQRNVGARLVEYRDGAWVMLDEIALGQSDIDNITSAWISKDDAGGIFAIFGRAGAVIRYRQNDSVIRFPLTMAPAAMAMTPIAIWGVGPEQFWVMDASGSVWKRSNERWRAVIRGLADEDIVFKDAWVAPSGTVFAITHDALYRLN